MISIIISAKIIKRKEWGGGGGFQPPDHPQDLPLKCEFFKSAPEIMHISSAT